MIKLCLVGGLGRMGRAVARLAAEEVDFEVVSVLESEETIRSAAGPGGDVLVTGDAVRAVEAADVVIDFSLPPGFDSMLAGLEAEPRPLVTGTTGVEDKEGRLTGLAGRAAVVSAPNMSVGVNIVFALAGLVADLAGEAADIELVETHHRTKKDVPSGTALEIADRISRTTGRKVTIGREAGTQTRSGEVFVHSLRMGSVAGEHTLALSLEGEVLKIGHTALSRDCFAAGALRAARFAARAAPGMYSMLDVLKLKSLER
jgi:4-hydroxy-tetrahydrodipicolinate reductase